MTITMNDIRREVARHGGRVEPDGAGGCDLLAPEGFLWKEAEVWCQPLPLGDAENRKERQEMLSTALAMLSGGVEPAKKGEK